MTQTITQSQIVEAKESLKKQKEVLKNLSLLEKAVNQHNKKLVDKRFFEKHFTEKNEYSTYTKFSISDYRYSFGEFKKQIWIGSNEYLELKTSGTQEIKNAIQQKKNYTLDYCQNLQNKIDQLGSSDEKSIIKNLRAVFFKHNPPEQLWYNLLKEYEVIYPKETNK